MSNIKFYPMHRDRKKAHESRRTAKGNKNATLSNFLIESDNKQLKTIALRVKFLLDKYKDDNDIRQKIIDELNIFRINLTICKELGDKKTFAKRVKEFGSFLNQF